MKKALSSAALVAAFLAPAAQAQSFLEVVNATSAGRTNGSSQILGGPVDYAVGRLRLTLDPRQLRGATISYAYESKDLGTGVRNQFFGPGGFSMIDSNAAFNTMVTAPVLTGLLDFSFHTLGELSGAANGRNYAWNDSNFGVSLDRGGLSGKLLFEDGAFGSGGMDYDDMVVRFQLNVSPVPEASSILMLAAGAAVLSLSQLRRLRRKGRPSDAPHTA